MADSERECSGSLALVRAAYDAIAPGYEEWISPSFWIRERLWERLDELFPPGSRILDATAGTGLDALHLERRGVRVTACDLSPGMLARLALRAPDVPVHVADLGRLDKAGLEGPFDGLISTFAGLNTVHTFAGLSDFARAAGRLVRPGGILFLHLLSRSRKRFRRTLNVPIAGIDVAHRLWTSRELARAFAADFLPGRIRGQGILRPVDDTRQLGGRDRWERLLGALPVFRGLGVFFTVEMVRRSQ